MHKKQIAITLGVMCFALTTAIVVQLRTVSNNNTTVSQSLKENSLRDEVLKWKEKYDNVYEELTTSTENLEKVRKQATQNDTTSMAKQQDITINNMLLGLTAVTGPGLEITLADNNTGLTQEGTEVLDISSQVVHNDDLLQVVNALNNAGAEAISINGQRVIQTSSITCEGNVIKINGQRISSPFIIKAIGSPGLLSGSLNMIGGYLYFMKEDGVNVETKQTDSITVEAYNGIISYKYIKLKK